MPEGRLNLKEIIEMAIEIERSGVEFYRRLKEMAKTSESADLFSSLEAAERQHVRDFEAILKSALAGRGRMTYAADETELLYLRAFASRRIFKSPEDAVRKVEALRDPLQGIDLALDFELLSVSFYQDMSRIIEDPNDRAAVHELEKQEREHATRLYRLREKIAPAA